TALSQLKEGDFYVFVDGKSGDARVAIRYEGSNKIAEMRGLGEGQSILPEDGELVNEVVETFSDGKSYKEYRDVQKNIIALKEGKKTISDLTEEELISLLTVEDRSYGERDELLRISRSSVKESDFEKFGYKAGEVVIGDLRDSDRFRGNPVKLLTGY